MYKIIQITDLRGENCRDPGSINRVGRIIDKERSILCPGKKGFMYCEKPDFLKSICLSNVEKVVVNNGIVTVTTENHVYHLAEITED